MFSKTITQYRSTKKSNKMGEWLCPTACGWACFSVLLSWITVAGLGNPPSWSFMIQWSYVVNHPRKQPGIWHENPKINNPIEWISNWMQIFKGHLGEVSAKLLHCWVGGFAQNDPDGSVASKVFPKEHPGEQVISPWAPKVTKMAPKVTVMVMMCTTPTWGFSYFFKKTIWKYELIGSLAVSTRHW